MFEAAEVGHELGKAEYQRLEPELRARLINAQYRLRPAGFPVMIVVPGDDHPGCDDVLQMLNEWLDARFVETNAYPPPTEAERGFPRFWRSWRELTPNGKIQSRKRTGLNAKQQRMVAQAVKRARYMGLLPYTSATL